eukprot:5310252-Pleurochrysis_carterae.AAC.1
MEHRLTHSALHSAIHSAIHSTVYSAMSPLPRTVLLFRSTRSSLGTIECRRPRAQLIDSDHVWVRADQREPFKLKKAHSEVKGVGESRSVEAVLVARDPPPRVGAHVVEAKLRPVSYTHLTLPTILLV